MIRRTHRGIFFGFRKERRERLLHKMAAIRAAKARKREELITAGLLEAEPKMLRWYRFEYGVRDTLTGETHFRPLVSVRQAAKALSLIQKFY